MIQMLFFLKDFWTLQILCETTKVCHRLCVRVIPVHEIDFKATCPNMQKVFKCSLCRQLVSSKVLYYLSVQQKRYFKIFFKYFSNRKSNVHDCRCLFYHASHQNFAVTARDVGVSMFGLTCVNKKRVLCSRCRVRILLMLISYLEPSWLLLARLAAAPVKRQAVPTLESTASLRTDSPVAIRTWTSSQ